MKTLHLIRHAKSSWDEPLVGDRDRGLNRRGLRDAPRMGRALAKEFAPLAACVSPARRAQLTLAGLCAGWPALEGLPHRTVESLYTFASADLVDFLRSQEDACGSLLLIGHNPALTDLVNELTAEGYLENLPTAAYARLLLDIRDWQELAPGCARLERLLLPRQLADID